jgi:hypothetical protein
MPNFPGYVREAFKDMIDTILVSTQTMEQCKAFRNARFDLDGKMLSANELCGILWNCNDICPRDTCETADLPHDSTYAQVARDVSRFFARKAVA